LRRLGLILGTAVVLIVVLFSVWIISRPERGTTGSVNTKFRLLGTDDKIVVDGYDDPKVEGVAWAAAGRGPTRWPRAVGSSPITGPSPLLRAAPPLRPASVLSPSRLEPFAACPFTPAA
jgi:hypothetical protein